MLPIEPALPSLRAALCDRTGAVLVAPPGAGKTTRVPLALLDEPWLLGRRILMLEPRRLAARAAARFMAASLGEQVGESVGYRVRLESRVGPHTRIEVITEGVLTRLLQADPALETTGLVIFDEFHERSLHADLGLALCLQSQSLLREDLRLLVMSATLEAEPVAALLGGVPVVCSEGRSFPVETRYLARPTEGRVEALVARTVTEALASEPEGDLLVFLPGAAEIHRVAVLLDLAGKPDVQVTPLYGSLSQEAQDLAITPGHPGQRKVVLATSIAETSLTVEGVRVVIDGGLSRVPRFSPRTGMARLETIAVSRASADQRRGRAGRLAPGVCYRLWTAQEDRQLAPRTAPEILEADLAPLALELAAWGAADPLELRWLDPPPAAAMAQARELLCELGALDQAGAITAHGRRMAELGMHPRLAHMALRGMALGRGALACELAALLSERDILRGNGPRPDADLRSRVEALRGEEHGYPVDVAARRRVAAEAGHWRRALGIGPGRFAPRHAVGADPGHAGGTATGHAGGLDPGQPCDLAPGDDAGLLLAFAYPDRIAQRRAAGRFLLRNGRGAAFAEYQPLADAPYLVAAELDDQGAESRIFLAAPLAPEALERNFGEQIETEDLIAWDRPTQAVRARRRTRLGALVLREAPLADPDPASTREALLHGIAAEGLAQILPWTTAARQLQDRLCFLHRLAPAAWPDAADEVLTATLPDWLGPHLHGLRSRDDLQRLHLVELLEAMLSWEQRRQLDDWAPTHAPVPSGSRIPIDYSDPAAPVLAVRLQEMFGLTDTPRIAGGRVPLTLHLLSPAQRPVQVTQDLASFWRSAYFEVRKDLRGRYPKHHWPEDPTDAVPTSRSKRRT
jgi:ATP-dependent helicase HrpB